MILAINTASEKNSIGLLGKNIAQETIWSSYRTQSKELLPKIDQLLRKNKIKLSDLDAIAVYQGPGSYTGLRVGISVANALAWGLDIPVIGVKDLMSKLPRRQKRSGLRPQASEKCQNYSLKLKTKPINSLTHQPISATSALEIAKRADDILEKKKLCKFSKIVIPYYGYPLK